MIGQKQRATLVAGKQKVDAVVIMVGINDLQPLKDGGDTLDPLSDKWRTVYAQRIENFVAPFHDAHIPVVWVGLPPMQDEKFNAQVSALNEIYRDTAEKAGANYIDIWDAFVDENGHFSAFGPDVDGQNTKLRSGPNGIYFTKAGSRKLAHFLETGIRRILRQGQAAERHRGAPAGYRTAGGRHQCRNPPRDGSEQSERARYGEAARRTDPVADRPSGLGARRADRSRSASERRRRGVEPALRRRSGTRGRARR